MDIQSDKMARNTLTSLMQLTYRRFNTKTALQYYRQGELETLLTYEQLHHDTNEMVQYLLNMGIKKGDRILLFMEKSIVFIVAHLAMQKIGAICVPINPGFKSSEVSYFIEDAAPALILAGTMQSTILDKISQGIRLVTVDPQTPYNEMTFFRDGSAHDILSENLPSDPALIIYTSGTTGKPKGAVLTQENLFQDIKNIQETWEIGANDVLCHALPLFHIHGLCFALHTCLAAGAKILLLDAFNPATVVNLLSKKKGSDICTLFMAVPTMYTLLMSYLDDKALDFSHLRLITSGSAPLLVKDFKRITHIWGQEPIEREGMSETGMNFSNPLHGIKKPGSIGLPLPQLQARIVDPETFADVQPGQIGEFWLKSPAITPGYWQKPAETEQTFEDGWFRTGDLGYVDVDGYYFLTDRIKNIIISGGENISPKEVESVINQLEVVTASSVVGINDEKWGEKVVAAVVLKQKSGITAEQILHHCKTHLHPWKCPKQIVFIDELPKNTMGKILNEEVRRLFEKD